MEKDPVQGRYQLPCCRGRERLKTKFKGRKPSNMTPKASMGSLSRLSYILYILVIGLHVCLLCPTFFTFFDWSSSIIVQEDSCFYVKAETNVHVPKKTVVSSSSASSFSSSSKLSFREIQWKEADHRIGNILQQFHKFVNSRLKSQEISEVSSEERKEKMEEKKIGNEEQEKDIYLGMKRRSYSYRFMEPSLFERSHSISSFSIKQGRDRNRNDQTTSQSEKNFSSNNNVEDIQFDRLDTSFLNHIIDIVPKKKVIKNSDLRKGRQNEGQNTKEEEWNDMEEGEEEEFIVYVEARATIKSLVKTCLRYKLIPKCIPYFKDMTIGGCIAGGASSSINSYKYGDFHSIVSEMTVLLPNGEIVDCSPRQNKELFNSLSGSCGSLGMILRVGVECVPLKIPSTSSSDGSRKMNQRIESQTNPLSENLPTKGGSNVEVTKRSNNYNYNQLEVEIVYTKFSNLADVMDYFERLHVLATEKSDEGFQGIGNDINSNRLPFGVEALVYPTIPCGTSKSPYRADKYKLKGENPQILVITSYLLPVHQNVGESSTHNEENNLSRGQKNDQNDLFSGDSSMLDYNNHIASLPFYSLSKNPIQTTFFYEHCYDILHGNLAIQEQNENSKVSSKRGENTTALKTTAVYQERMKLYDYIFRYDKNLFGLLSDQSFDVSSLAIINPPVSSSPSPTDNEQKDFVTAPSPLASPTYASDTDSPGNAEEMTSATTESAGNSMKANISSCTLDTHDGVDHIDMDTQTAGHINKPHISPFNAFTLANSFAHFVSVKSLLSTITGNRSNINFARSLLSVSKVLYPSRSLMKFVHLCHPDVIRTRIVPVDAYLPVSTLPSFLEKFLENFYPHYLMLKKDEKKRIKERNDTGDEAIISVKNEKAKTAVEDGKEAETVDWFSCSIPLHLAPVVSSRSRRPFNPMGHLNRMLFVAVNGYLRLGNTNKRFKENLRAKKRQRKQERKSTSTETQPDVEDQIKGRNDHSTSSNVHNNNVNDLERYTHIEKDEVRINRAIESLITAHFGRKCLATSYNYYPVEEFWSGGACGTISMYNREEYNYLRKKYVESPTAYEREENKGNQAELPEGGTKRKGQRDMKYTYKLAGLESKVLLPPRNLNLMNNDEESPEALSIDMDDDKVSLKSTSEQDYETSNHTQKEDSSANNSKSRHPMEKIISETIPNRGSSSSTFVQREGQFPTIKLNIFQRYLDSRRKKYSKYLL